MTIGKDIPVPTRDEIANPRTLASNLSYSKMNLLIAYNRTREIVSSLTGDTLGDAEAKEPELPPQSRINPTATEVYELTEIVNQMLVDIMELLGMDK